MATLGLRVNQDPTLNLSGIFKSAMADPELAIKGELAKSQIWSNYYDNLLRQQQAEEQRQLGIKTGQEAATLAAQQAAKDAAAGPYGQTLADAIHDPAMPVPVDHTPPAAQSLIGPGMPYISPDQKATYDQGMTAAENQRKAQRLLGPAIVQMGKDAADLATGTGRASGNAILLGNPAPDQARIGATLSTGNLPSTSTVVTSGDYAGTDAAARQAIVETAGKLPYNIAQDRAKAQAEADAKVAARPLGDSETAIYRAKLAELEAKRLRSPTGVLSQEEEQLYQLLDRTVSKSDQTVLGKDQRIVAASPEGTGSVVTVPGSAPAAADASGMYADPSATDARQLGGITATVRKLLDPKYKPGQQEAIDYNSAYTERYLQGKETIEPSKIRVPAMGIEVGDPVRTVTKPVIPAGYPTPQDVYARAGIPYPGPPAAAAPTPDAVTPVVAPAAAPAPAAAGQAKTANGVPVDVGPVATLAGPNGGVSVQKIANGSGAPATEAEGKLRGYAGRAVFGTAYLDKLTGADIPDALTQYFNNPSNGDLTSQYVQSIADPSTRQYMMFATAYLTAMLRKDSGAAITPQEFQLYREFIPKPGDDAGALASRREARHQFIRSSLRDGYTTDQRGLKIAEDEARAYNVHLEPDPNAIPLTPTEQRNAPTTFSDGRPLTPMPQGIGIDPSAWPNFTPQGEADAIKLYNMMKAKGLVK